jgi:DNA-binding CsgD family transcriptional regulator
MEGKHAAEGRFSARRDHNLCGLARYLPPGRVAKLSVREREVLVLLAKGHLYKEIADLLAIGYGTVHNHLRHIYEKLHVRSQRARPCGACPARQQAGQYASPLRQAGGPMPDRKLPGQRLPSAVRDRVPALPLSFLVITAPDWTDRQFWPLRNRPDLV